MNPLQKLAGIGWREIVNGFESDYPHVLDQIAKPFASLGRVRLDAVIASIICVPKIIHGPLVARFGRLHLLLEAP